MSSTLRFRKKIGAVVLVLLLTGVPVTTFAADDNAEAPGESSWWDKAKDAGADTIDWVKEKAPVAKEKAGEVWDKAKEKAGKARDDFREWNQSQEDEFWERTDDQLNGSDNQTDSDESELESSSLGVDPGLITDEDLATDEGLTTDEEVDSDVSNDKEARETEEPKTDSTDEIEASEDKADELKSEDTKKGDRMSMFWILVIVFGGGIVSVVIYLKWSEWYDNRS